MSDNYDGKYKNFMFMAGWRDTLEGYVADFGIAYAQEALWNLMLAGTLEGQELATEKESIRNFIKGCILPVINKSTKSYNQNKENGKKGGRPSKVDEVDVEEAFRLHDEEHKTWKEVAKVLGVSADTLKKARDAFSEAEKPKNLKRETEKPKNETEKVSEVFCENSNNDTNDSLCRKTEKPKPEFIF